MKLKLYPYKLNSVSARNLAEALNIKRVREDGKYKHFRNHLVINWGNPRLPRWWTPDSYHKTLNKPQAVQKASDKLVTYHELFNEETLQAHLPPFSTRQMEAREWFTGEYPKVLCRTLTRGNSGRGIVVAKTPEELVAAPLYVKYVPKKDEYRVHVINGTVVDIQEKRLRNGAREQENYNKYIRNHPNGWVFCREDVSCPEIVQEVALKSVVTLGLDFGAVDIGYHKTHGAMIYEVNTAPGLEGATLENYANYFSSL